jgi:hypothetical protein
MSLMLLFDIFLYFERAKLQIISMATPKKCFFGKKISFYIRLFICCRLSTFAAKFYDQVFLTAKQAIDFKSTNYKFILNQKKWQKRNF